MLGVFKLECTSYSANNVDPHADCVATETKVIFTARPHVYVNS